MRCFLATALTAFFSVELATSECRAEFAYAPQGDSQVSIGPVICK
jgi:hypothetical protein